jgi:putative membrane protein
VFVVPWVGPSNRDARRGGARDRGCAIPWRRRGARVTVAVHRGEVKLEGSVPERSMRYPIEDLAAGRPAVKEVDKTGSGLAGARCAAASVPHGACYHRRMSPLVTDLHYLLPWQFYPSVFLACAIVVWLYARGLFVLRRRGTRVGFGRAFTFYAGVALSYAVLQTYVDFLAQHMFWIHRLQHLILHHIGPVLMVLAAPEPVLRAGTPAMIARWLSRVPQWIRRPVRALFRILQNPVVAPTLFVGLIFFWLTPSIHFTAMLDARRYLLMNWSMLIDGILFWWLMLAPRQAQGSAAIGYGTRIVILVIIAVPQMLLGAFIALHSTPLYSIYAVCGRAWDLSPLTDQQYGGLLTWIPAAMMSVVGVLAVLHHILNDPEAKALRPPQPLAPPAQPASGA